MFQLPKLPYKYDALEPYIDAKTMEIHHTKHHQAYVDNANKALEKYPELLKKPVEELLKDLSKIPEEARTAFRNHGGGVANHNLFWTIMTPNSDKVPKGEIANAIEKEFQSFEKFKEIFSSAAMSRFGSGWAWLVFNKGRLEVYNLPNQDTPLSEGKIPLLALDVWEHAYYLKYQNRRKEYVDNWWNVVNWKEVDRLFREAKK
ncbi:MAG: superoxide dismutase [Candidatus Woesearchaeota archaeon]